MFEKGWKFLVQFFRQAFLQKKKKKKKTHAKKNWFLFGHLILSFNNFDNFMVLKGSVFKAVQKIKNKNLPPAPIFNKMRI